MEILLDRIWEHLYRLILYLVTGLDGLLAPIHNGMGPLTVILLLAVVTICLTKFLGKICRTKRHAVLKKDFDYWLTVREEAMRCDDLEKGKRMARNIDQAKLNRCYYDYFLEGLLLSLFSLYLPILAVMSYVNSFYRPERLLDIIGRDYLLQFGSSGSEPVLVGAVFCYFISLISLYAGFFILQKGMAWMRRSEINNGTLMLHSQPPLK